MRIIKNLPNNKYATPHLLDVCIGFEILIIENLITAPVVQNNLSVRSILFLLEIFYAYNKTATDNFASPRYGRSR